VDFFGCAQFEKVEMVRLAGVPSNHTAPLSSCEVMLQCRPDIWSLGL
jgi:hypothetical protein